MKTFEIKFHRFFSKVRTIELNAPTSELAIQEAINAFGSLDRILSLKEVA